MNNETITSLWSQQMLRETINWVSLALSIFRRNQWKTLLKISFFVIRKHYSLWVIFANATGDKQEKAIVHFSMEHIDFLHDSTVAKRSDGCTIACIYVKVQSPKVLTLRMRGSTSWGDLTFAGCVVSVHSINQNGVTIDLTATCLRQIKHMVSGSTQWSQFISICPLYHCTKVTLLILSELMWPNPNAGVLN